MCTLELYKVLHCSPLLTSTFSNPGANSTCSHLTLFYSEANDRHQIIISIYSVACISER